MEKENKMFNKELFSNDGPYLRYDNSIVARFKHTGGPFTKAKFKKFLIKSGLTVDKYFSMRESGIAPLDVWAQLDMSSYRSTIDAWRNK